MQTIQVSTVLRPRGLKGEIKCRHFDVRKGTNIEIGGKNYRIANVGTYKDFTYLFLDGIDTIEKAETLRNKPIHMNRGDLNLADDEILITDLIGYAVIDQNGKHIGTVKSVDNYGGGDIITTENASFPFEDAFIIETNITERTITVRQ